MSARNIKITLPNHVWFKSSINKIKEGEWIHPKFASVHQFHVSLGLQEMLPFSGINTGMEQGKRIPLIAYFQSFAVSRWPVTYCLTFFFSSLLVNLLPTAPDEKSNTMNGSSSKEKRNQIPISFGKKSLLQFLALGLLYALWIAFPFPPIFQHIWD